MDYFWKSDVRRALHRMRDLKEIDELMAGEILDILTGQALFSRWLAGPEAYQ